MTRIIRCWTAPICVGPARAIDAIDQSESPLAELAGVSAHLKGDWTPPGRCERGAEARQRSIGGHHEGELRGQAELEAYGRLSDKSPPTEGMQKKHNRAPRLKSRAPRSTRGHAMATGHG